MFLAMAVFQYVLVTYLVLTGFFSPILLIVFVSLYNNRMFTVYRQPRPTEKPKALPDGIWPLYLVAFAFDHNRKFGSLFLLGLILDAVLF